MKGLVVKFIVRIFFLGLIWLMVSNCYFGIVDENGEKVTDLSEVLASHQVISLDKE